MRIVYFGDQVATVDPFTGYKLTGSPAIGGHALTLNVAVRFVGKPPGEDVDLVSIAGVLIADSKPVANLEPVPVKLQGTGREPKTVEFALRCLLDIRQLTALHATRGRNGDVTISVALRYVLTGPKGVFDWSDYHERIVISHADWSTALAATGFGTTVLCDVVVPTGSTNAGLVAGVEGLRRAQEAVRNSDVVSYCRVALDDADVGTKFPDKLTTEGLSVNFGGRRRQEVTLDERLALLRWAANMAMNPPHHTTTVEYDRAQARLLMQITAALLEYEASHA